MTRFQKALDGWLGRGDASITTPPMDGAFRPNDLLDAASVVLAMPAPDALAVTTLGLVVSSGRSLLRVERPGEPPVASFDAEISALVGCPTAARRSALPMAGSSLLVASTREKPSRPAPKSDASPRWGPRGTGAC